MIDVDNFGTINDRYGHAAGDAVLISIANACMATMRKSDVFGRLGGEEFGLLLPETDADEAFDAAERIRRVVEGTIIEAAGASIRATISLGIAPIPAAAEGSNTWFQKPISPSTKPSASAATALWPAGRGVRNRSPPTSPIGRRFRTDLPPAPRRC